MFLGIASFALLTALAASVTVIKEVSEEERLVERERARYRKY
jgi:hypothetical protein